VYNSFARIVAEEIAFRKLQIESNDVLDDIFNTALLIETAGITNPQLHRISDELD